MKREPIPDAERFLDLFQSNPRSTGRFDPSSGKMHTDYESARTGDVERHLRGEYGIGLVPILDDDTCRWAAIDIDSHGSDEDIPIAPIDAKLAVLALPLIPCRSKSGGVHVYAFFDKPWPAVRARQLMTNVAAQIGYPKSEIFPKQTRLAGIAGGKKQLGNWINLPYLNGNETVRYAYRHGRKLTLVEFLKTAESNKVDQGVLARQVLAEHAEAPPCIQSMLTEGVGKGQRNEGLYNIAVYSRKAFADDFKLVAMELNTSTFETPLAKGEAERTVMSAGRPEMRYRCNEEPIKSLCDRPTCLKRKFGVTDIDVQEVERIGELPTFTDLIKHMTDPVRWEFKVDGVPVRNVTTDDLLDWRAMRRIIAERLTKVVPMLKIEEWSRILQPLMLTACIEEAPEDAGPAGAVRARLREFAGKAHDLHDNKNVGDRQALLRGLPIMADINGVKSIAFRSNDFINYLKRTKSEELKGANLWFAVREIGLQTTRMRVSKEKSINVWFVPFKEIEYDLALPAPAEIRSEI